MRKNLIAGIAVIVCIVSALCTSIGGKADSIQEKELENYIINALSAANIPGMGISIVSSEKELYCAAYGAAQEPESDYVLGSLSKSFTAAAIMHLQEEEELSLDDKVSDYLTGYKAVSDVTISELLHQTSGISSEETMSALQGNGQRGAFEYANANYNLLGEIIEAASGLTYEEYISDNILDPLDMTSTYSMRTGADMSEELLPGYQNYFGFPFPVKHQYDKEEDWIQAPSGYLISDAKDMGKYLQMYLNKGGGILSEESVHAMLYQGTDMSSDRSVEDDFFEGTAEYGMGWMAKQVDGQAILYHSGKTEGFTAMMVLLPEQDLGITMLFNSMDFLVGQNLIEKMEEGIVSLEMGNTPVEIDSHAYLLRHGLLDGLLLLLVILAWMPVFLMGVWWKRRCRDWFSPIELAVDVAIHIVLPTALIFILPNIVPSFMVKRFVPDVYYVLCAVIISLYLGAVIKLLAGLILLLKKKEGILPSGEAKEEQLGEGQELEEQPKTENKENKNMNGQPEKEESNDTEPEQEEKQKEVSGNGKPEKKEPEVKKPRQEGSGKKTSGQKQNNNRKKGKR